MDDEYKNQSTKSVSDILNDIRGYYDSEYSYRGLVNGRWMQFSSEEDYFDYIKELYL